MSPRQIAPFLRGNVQWARVPRLAGRSVQRSLGVSDAAEAREVCRFLVWLRGRGARSAYLLDRLAGGATPVLAAYHAYVENRLDAFEQELRDGIADPDIEPHVAAWRKEMERQWKPSAATVAKYVRQVRTLLPEGQRFPRSTFTKRTIRAWLGGLDVGQPNRYRAALSSFANYLVFEDVLASNPVRLVPMAKEREPRTTHLTPGEASRLVRALPEGYAALHALMLATGIEVSAALRLRRRDVSPEHVHARGTKRQHRDRTCTVYSRWTAFWIQHVASYVADRGLLPDALVFAGLNYRGARLTLRAAAASLTDLPAGYRIHDHRHTWAVQAVRDGLALHTIAHQLGHRDAVMVLKVYGRFVPNGGDFDRSATESATPAKTAPTETRTIQRA